MRADHVRGGLVHVQEIASAVAHHYRLDLTGGRDPDVLESVAQLALLFEVDGPGPEHEAEIRRVAICPRCGFRILGFGPPKRREGAA